MSQRMSGYDRRARDVYETPGRVTAALLPHLPPRMFVWEPAAGSGKMVAALRAAGHRVIASDIVEGGDPSHFRGRDFLQEDKAPLGCQAIITNPPYELAREFIEHVLDLMRPRGVVAMLLRCDFDHAATRAHLFGGCPAFARKVVLTKRVVWFEAPGAAPSFNHAWFVWDWKHSGPPVLAYGPAPA
jgi:hypothetical protein